MYCGGGVRSPGRWAFREENASVRVLGVHLGLDQRAARDNTWSEVLNKMKNTLELWKMWKLTLKGKVVMVNSLILSKMNHVLQVYDLPKQTHSEINQMISNFLWGSRRNMIAHRTTIDEYTNGGLKLIDIKTKTHSFRIKIIKKLLENKTDFFWKHQLLNTIKTCGNSGIYNLCHTPLKSQAPQNSQFMREILEAWELARPHLVTIVQNKHQLLQLPVFHNPDITHLGRPI